MAKGGSSAASKREMFRLYDWSSEGSLNTGDVATLRTRLQARRATLNEEIYKEDKFHKGSKKLVGISVDPKIKDQATLEMNFAESKIKALQSELSKINSSLQAYQAEGTQESQVPLIPVVLKTTTEVSFVSSFSDIISKHYHRDPALFRENIFDFQELRESMSEVTRDMAGVKALCEYYNQLQLVGKRFLHPRIRHGIVFTWYDAINGLPAAQQSIVFERACVLFNLTALHTQIAARQDRSTEEGIDAAVKSLEKAIGYLEYMKEKFSHSPTKDMSEDMLTLLSNLMKAQAQEMLWEKHQLIGLKDDIASLIDYAHKTKSIADCYHTIRQEIDTECMKNYLPGCWTSIIKIKDAHYQALAHYYAAMTHELLAATYSGGGRIPEEIHTELHFLYPNSPSEVFSPDPRQQVGLMKAHLNCASLSHEYALKYSSLCRELLPLLPLREMLSAAEEMTRLKKEVAAGMEGVMVVAPTIQSSTVKLSPVRPDFYSIKVQDMFRQLGPLPAFSADNSWSPPRTASLGKEQAGFGISIRGCRPVTISEVDEGSPAEAMGVNVEDWILAVNGVSVLYKTHSEVVQLIKDSGDELALELTTPAHKTGSEQRNGCT